MFSYISFSSFLSENKKSLYLLISVNRGISIKLIWPVN